jgi:hypothetical protein
MTETRRDDQIRTFRTAVVLLSGDGLDRAHGKYPADGSPTLKKLKITPEQAISITWTCDLRTTDNGCRFGNIAVDCHDASEVSARRSG